MDGATVSYLMNNGRVQRKDHSVVPDEEKLKGARTAFTPTLSGMGPAHTMPDGGLHQFASSIPTGAEIEEAMHAVVGRMSMDLVRSRKMRWLERLRVREGHFKVCVAHKVA